MERKILARLFVVCTVEVCFYTIVRLLAACTVEVCVYTVARLLVLLWKCIHHCKVSGHAIL